MKKAIKTYCTDHEVHLYIIKLYHTCFIIKYIQYIFHVGFPNQFKVDLKSSSFCSFN